MNHLDDVMPAIISTPEILECYLVETCSECLPAQATHYNDFVLIATEC